MNQVDIDALQERINRIAYEHASPDIIIAPRPKISLITQASHFQANKCILLMMYNEYRGRMLSFPTRDLNGDIKVIVGSVSLAHIIAAMSISDEDLNRLITIASQEFAPDIWNRTLESQARTLHDILSLHQDYDLEITSIGSAPIHRYICQHASSGNILDIRATYNQLKSMINMSGKVLSIQAIVGAMVYTYSPENIRISSERNRVVPTCVPVPIDTATLYSIISRMEYDGSPLAMNQQRFDDAIAWYDEQLKFTIDPTVQSFYRTSLTNLMSIATVPLQLYAPQVDIERMIIRPTQPIDIVDTISVAKASSTIPILMANTGEKIIKVFNKAETMRKLQISWFMDSKLDRQLNVLNLMVRISKYPEKYQMVQYNADKNYFLINRANRYMSTSDLVATLCNGLGLRTLTVPQIANTTYYFVTNYIEATNDRGKPVFGLDQHILAWLITNPPSEYQGAHLDQYIFVKEDTKPNALRDHISIHIQLGTEKLYLTISREETTSGTIVPLPDATNISTDDTEAAITRNLVGFQKKQKYLQIRINKAQSIHHAHIAQTIYHHLISMYIKYFNEVRREISIMTRGQARINTFDPAVLPLIQVVPPIHKKYAFYDPILYKYVSDIQPTSLLPVPIEREEVAYWEARMYSVMRLPTLVVNNPLITFETSGEIWLRTSMPNTRFTLIKKKKGGYIPIMQGKRTGIDVTVNSDMTLIGAYPSGSGNAYALDATKSLGAPNKVGRLAHISDSMIKMLQPIIPTGRVPDLRRVGISMNMLDAMNNALEMDIRARTVSTYAYMCLQECWEQSVEEIQEDILNLRIHPMRHFRALEMAYKANMYFTVDDPLGPYLNKPPHLYFYLHRRANPSWPCILLHSLRDELETFSMLVLNEGAKISRNAIYTFQDQAGYLDDLITLNNQTRMISPADGLNIQLTTVPIQMNLGQWYAHEQIVDAVGKCRGITYKRVIMDEAFYTTINIGFAPVQELPLGEIKEPTLSGTTSMMLLDLRHNATDAGFTKALESLIMRPSRNDALSSWSIMEKEARILKVVTHLLYSQMNISLDTFSDQLVVREGIHYDLSNVKHALPNIGGSSDQAWEYMASILPTMVDDDEYEIMVPSLAMKDALLLYLRATPKIRWPLHFPSYVLYTWDVASSRDEAVFLRDTDLIQYLIMRRAPIETTTLIISPIPYILTRRGYKYLVQMTIDISHAKYVAYRWDEESLNPGYEGIITSVDYPVNMVSPDFTDKLTQIAFAKMDARIFVIIPLS